MVPLEHILGDRKFPQYIFYPVRQKVTCSRMEKVDFWATFGWDKIHHKGTKNVSYLVAFRCTKRTPFLCIFSHTKANSEVYPFVQPKGGKKGTDRNHFQPVKTLIKYGAIDNYCIHFGYLLDRSFCGFVCRVRNLASSRHLQTPHFLICR